MKTKHRLSNLVPWLITLRDLQRYTGRALRECQTGRVPFLWANDCRTRKRMLMAISSYPDRAWSHREGLCIVCCLPGAGNSAQRPSETALILAVPSLLRSRQRQLD